MFFCYTNPICIERKKIARFAKSERQNSKISMTIFFIFHIAKFRLHYETFPVYFMLFFGAVQPTSDRGSLKVESEDSGSTQLLRKLGHGRRAPPPSSVAVTCLRLRFIIPIAALAPIACVDSGYTGHTRF